MHGCCWHRVYGHSFVTGCGATSFQSTTPTTGKANAVAAGCDGVRMVPDLLVGGGGVGGGAFSGLSINTSRGHLYRATLEALSAKLAHQLHELERICGFKAEELILVGGGSKNRLWNQIKADALKIPVRVVAENEMTVLGAALYGFCGLGYYPTPQAASAVPAIRLSAIDTATLKPVLRS